jgi:hypothetical protein
MNGSRRSRDSYGVSAPGGRGSQTPLPLPHVHTEVLIAGVHVRGVAKPPAILGDTREGHKTCERRREHLSMRTSSEMSPHELKGSTSQVSRHSIHLFPSNKGA